MLPPLANVEGVRRKPTSTAGEGRRGWVAAPRIVLLPSLSPPLKPLHLRLERTQSEDLAMSNLNSGSAASLRRVVMWTQPGHLPTQLD